MMKSTLLLLRLSATLPLLASCSSVRQGRVQSQFGESLVFIGEEPAALAFTPANKQAISVRNTYLPSSNSVSYVEGQDYLVDYALGTLRRTPESRLPDFRKNILFGQENFDHTKFPGFGNSGYFAFIDYHYKPQASWPAQRPQSHFLTATQAKLKAGQPVKIVAFGDSITAGGDASKPELIFWRRWAAALQNKYPAARIMAVNGATGGDSTYQGLERLQPKVLDQKPDLVLVGFGMNDHNINSVPIPQFKDNLRRIVVRIRDEAKADVILFSAFPPNPNWKFGSHHMQDYAEATRQAAADAACAYADVFTNWQTLAARKKPEDLLGNNINHPNDFGHWIYFRVLEAMDL